MDGSKRKAGSIESFFQPPAAKKQQPEAVVVVEPAVEPAVASDSGLTVCLSHLRPPLRSLTRRVQPEQQRRIRVNRALALAKATHLRACAAADTARRDGRQPRLAELLVGEDWSTALQTALNAASFRALEAVRVMCSRHPTEPLHCHCFCFPPAILTRACKSTHLRTPSAVFAR